MDEDLQLACIKRPADAGADDDEEVVEVWEENWESFVWFTRLWRRWVFNQLNGQRIRIDEQAALTHLKIAGIKKKRRRTIMEDLLAIEPAVLKVLSREQ